MLSLVDPATNEHRPVLTRLDRAGARRAPSSIAGIGPRTRDLACPDGWFELPEGAGSRRGTGSRPGGWPDRNRRSRRTRGWLRRRCGTWIAGCSHGVSDPGDEHTRVREARHPAEVLLAWAGPMDARRRLNTSHVAHRIRLSIATGGPGVEPPAPRMEADLGFRESGYRPRDGHLPSSPASVSSIPHLGHVPGCACRTSGCIEQV